MKQTYQEAQAAELERYYDEEARAEDPLGYCELVIKIGWFAFLAAVGVALAVMLSGCGGQAEEESEVVETGTAEQASINQFRTDDRGFTMSVDGLAPQAPPGSGGGTADYPCSRFNWSGAAFPPNVPGWAPNGAHRGLLLPSVAALAIELDVAMSPNAPSGGQVIGVCPMACRGSTPGSLGNCPFPQPRSRSFGFAQQAQNDPWFPDFAVQFQSGSAGGALALPNNVTSADGVTRLGYSLLLNVAAIKATAASLGIGEQAVTKWLLCRHLGLAVGLNPRASNLNTCMGNQPTTGAQWNARGQWDATDRSDIRAVTLSRPVLREQ